MKKIRVSVIAANLYGRINVLDATELSFAPREKGEINQNVRKPEQFAGENDLII